jgi:cobalt-zinc-cadmium efflux system outer membrane protein
MAVLMIPQWSFSQQTTEARLQQLITDALQNNPSLEVAMHHVAAKEIAISQSAALPDPKLSFGFLNLPVNNFAFNQEPMTGKQVSLMQMFPLGGKLGLNKKMAEFAKTVELYKQQEIKNQVIASVKIAYFELYVADRGIETVLSNKELMRQLVRVAETKYATGNGLQQDILRAQVELSKIDDDLLMWQQQRIAAVARLNVLLNRSQNNDFIVTPIDLDLTISNDFTGPLAKARPLLRVWQEMISLSETAVERKKRDYWPDLTVSAAYTQRDNRMDGTILHDFFSATASINIPLFFKGKQSAAVQQEEADLAAVEAQYQDVLNSVRSDSVSVAAELDRNRKRVALYDDGILLQAEQSLKSALSGYQVGKVDFITLINNWTLLQNYQLMAFRAKADYRISLAKFEQILGIHGD